MFFPTVLNINLKKFLNSFKELENNYLTYANYLNENRETRVFQRNILSPQWRTLTDYIFTSIVAVSDFIDEFRKTRFKEKPEQFTIYAFYGDLLLSKIKHSFATEIPRMPFYLPTILLYEKVPALGEKLLIYETNPERIPVLFLKFYMRLFLTYDFVFYKNEGVFTRFKLSKEFFEHIKGIVFLNDLHPSGSNFLKNYLKNLIIRYIKASLKFWIDNFQEIEDKEVYKKFIETYKEGKHKVFFEPFTYFLAFKMWKYGKLLQTTFEFCKVDEREAFYTEFTQKLEEYKKEQLEAMEQFYTNKITNEDLLKKIFETDKDFLENHIFTEVLAPYNVVNESQFNSLCNKIEKIYTPSSGNEKLSQDGKKIENLEFRLKNIFENYLINNEEYDKFKWERILLKGDALEITLMLTLFKKLLFGEKIQYIGILRAGGLLAHCLNVMTHQNELCKYPVVLFSSFPYLSFLPRDINVLKAKDLQKVPLIIVDESIKSSFTFAMLMSYICRNFDKFKIQREITGLLCLTDIEGFERYGISQFQGKIFSLAELSIEDAKLKLKKLNVPSSIFEQELFDWKAFIERLPEDPSGLFEEIKAYLKSKIKNKERLNVIHVLSNSVLLFSAAKGLAKKLKNEASCHLAFYYTTDEGKILTDAIMFVMKFLYENINFTVITEKEEWDNFKANHSDATLVFTDMTVDTMHTFWRSLKMDFEINELKNIEQLNIKIATIFASREAQEKLKKYLLCLANLRD